MTYNVFGGRVGTLKLAQSIIDDEPKAKYSQDISFSLD